MGFCSSCSCLCKCCGEIFFVVLNIFSTLFGLAIVAIGVVLALFWKLEFVEEAIMEFLTTALSPANAQSVFNEISNHTTVLGIVVGSIGCGILLISLFGCLGSCCHSACLMATYSLLLGILAVALLACTITVASNESIVLDPIESWMYVRLTENFTDPLNNVTGPTTVVGFTASATMLYFECCGVRSYTDFQNCDQWNRNYTISEISVYARVPSACCKFDWKNVSLDASNYHCLDYPNATNSNFDQACFPVLSKYLQLGLAWTLAAVGIVAALILVLFVYTATLTGIYMNKKVHKECEKRKQYYALPDSSYLASNETIKTYA